MANPKLESEQPPVQQPHQAIAEQTGKTLLADSGQKPEQAKGVPKAEGQLQHGENTPQKRAGDTATMVEKGALPGVVLDFSSDRSVGKQEKAESALQPEGRKAINDQEAKAVSDLVKGLDIKRFSVDHVSGQSDLEPARSKDVDGVARALSVLTKEDIDKVNSAYGGKGALDAIQNNPALSAADKEKLAIYGQGVDQRQKNPELTLKLGELAIASGNIGDFTHAFAGATPQAREAFLANPDNNPSRGQQAIDRAFSGQDRVSASEFVRDGKVSLATQINREGGSRLSRTNYDAVERSLKHISQEESAQYTRGAKLTEQKDGMSANLSESEKLDRAKFVELDTALQDAAGNNTVRLAYWRSLAKQDGQSSNFIDAVAADGGRFFNGSVTDGLINGGTAHHLKDSWDKQSYDFYNDPLKGAVRREAAHQVLNMFADTNLQAQFDKQVQAPSYEESARLAGKQAAPEGDHKSLPALSNAVTVSPDGSVVTTSTAATLRSVEKSLQEDGRLQDRIANPKTTEDLAVRDNLRGNAALVFGKDSEAYKQYLELEKGQKVSPETWAKLDKDEARDLHSGFINDLAGLPKEKRDQISSDQQLKQQVLGHLDKDYRQVAEQVLAHGLQPADSLQLALLQKDSRGAEDAIARGAKENLPQFKQDFESTYGKSLEAVTRETVHGQRGIELERALAADKSAIDQYQTDLRLKDQLYAPVIDSVASLFGSNAPRRERESFDTYTAAVGRNQVDKAGAGDRQAQETYRDERDSLNKTEKQVIQTGTNVALTALGAATTGGAGWAAFSLASLGRAKEVAQLGSLAISAGGTPLVRSELLGRLHDQQASTYLRDGVEGLAGTYLGGGNLATFNLKRAPESIEGAATKKVTEAIERGTFTLPANKTVGQAVGDHNYVTGYGHLAYPFISNTAFATASSLADGKTPAEALWNGATTGVIAASGVGSAWVISRGTRALAPEPVAKFADNIIQNKPLSVAGHRAGGGGTSKGVGKSAEIQSPHGRRTAESYLPGVVIEY